MRVLSNNKARKAAIAVLSAFAWVALAISASGAVLVSYNFTDNTGTPSSAYPNVTAGSITNGGLNGYLTYSGGKNPALSVGSLGTADTADGAVTGNDYFGFTITAAQQGYAINLSGQTMTFDVQAFNNGLNANWFLRSSVGGFSANLRSGSVTKDWSSISITLPSSSSYDDLSSFSVRLYVYDKKDNSEWTQFDNFTLNGSVSMNVNPVPEPYEYGLIAVVGLLGYGIYERRRMQKA
jgi:hypothetical protein